jgi:predicted flap endonuclease-1-like 5' DNA nuclease
MWRKLSFYRQAVIATIVSAALVFLLVWVRRQSQAGETNSRLLPLRKAPEIDDDLDYSSSRTPAHKSSEILISQYKLSSSPEPTSEAASNKTRQKESVTKPKPAAKDGLINNLTSITGIGPKTAEALQKAGILSFKDLAGLDEQSLGMIMKEQGIRITRTQTWAEQASIADKKGLEKLKEYQASMKND